MKKILQYFIDISKGTVFGIRLKAVFETIVFLSFLVICNTLFGDGKRFINTSPNPFWIIILLVTVQYGTGEGIIAVILSTIFLYAGNIPHQKLTETTFDWQYNLSFLPLIWFITAFILGSLRMRQEDERISLEKENEKVTKEVEKITGEYLSLKETNQNLEIFLASQEETTASTFQVFKALSALSPSQIILGAESLIELALHPEKFSLYALGKNGLEAVISHGWGLDDHFIRRFSKDSKLYRAIVEDRRLVSIIQKEDKFLLENEGVLAAPLIDPKTGEVFGMSKVEDVEFLSLNLSRIETFKIICELIGEAYSNAKRHTESEKKSIFAFGESIFANSLYEIEKSHLILMANKFHFFIGDISLTLISDQKLTEPFLHQIKGALPKEAFCFAGHKKDTELLILWPIQEATLLKAYEVEFNRVLKDVTNLSEEDYKLKISIIEPL